MSTKYSNPTCACASGFNEWAWRRRHPEPMTQTLIYTTHAYPIAWGYFLLTLGAHAQRGLQYLVCLCVCVSTLINSGTTGYEAIPMALEPQVREKYKGDFLEKTVFKRYAVK